MADPNIKTPDTVWYGYCWCYERSCEYCHAAYYCDHSGEKNICTNCYFDCPHEQINVCHWCSDDHQAAARI